MTARLRGSELAVSGRAVLSRGVFARPRATGSSLLTIASDTRALRGRAGTTLKPVRRSPNTSLDPSSNAHEQACEAKQGTDASRNNTGRRAKWIWSAPVDR